MKVYGLSNCDTTRAAIKWLKEHKMEYQFHDYKLNGITSAQILKWLGEITIEKLLNKNSTTWRGLTAEQQAAAADLNGAIELMTSHPTLLKRPLIEWPGTRVSVGFNEKLFAEMRGTGKK